MTAPVRKERHIPWFLWMAGAISVVMAALILYPLGYVVWRQLVLQAGAIPGLIAEAIDDGIGGILLQTLLVVGAAVAIATVVGTAFAWLAERTDLGMRGLMRFLPVIPLFVPAIAGAIGWVLLGSPRTGFLNRWMADALALVGIPGVGPIININSYTGLIFVFVIYLIPNVFLTTSSHLRNLDPALEEAARMSGAGLFQTLLRVTVPSIAPAALTGMLLALIMGLSLYSLPVVIGTPARIELLSVHIVDLMISTYPPQTSMALLLCGILVLAISAATWLQWRIVTRGNFATIVGKGGSGAEVRLGIYKWPARLIFVLYLTMSTVLPFVALLIASLQPFWTPAIDFANLGLSHYNEIFVQSRKARSAIFNSLVLGILGGTACMAIACMIAYYIDRKRATVSANAMEVLTKLPGAVSHIVVGIAFIVAFSGAPFYLFGTLTLLFLAYLVLYIPQATLSATAARHQIGPQLTEAALMAGASPGRAYLRIALPLMLPGLVAGWTLLFVLITGDITASAMLSGNRNPVVGFVILDIWAGGSFPQLAALGTVMTVVSSLVVLATMRLTRS
jgi:iron(III) transport system permease protein